MEEWRPHYGATQEQKPDVCFILFSWPLGQFTKLFFAKSAVPLQRKVLHRLLPSSSKFGMNQQWAPCLQEPNSSCMVCMRLWCVHTGIHVLSYWPITLLFLKRTCPVLLPTPPLISTPVCERRFCSATPPLQHCKVGTLCM